jgi:hypothetical protein
MLVKRERQPETQFTTQLKFLWSTIRANWRALSIATKFLAFTDNSTCTCCQELDGHWTCKKRLLLLYSYCNLFVLGFMAKKEPMPFMQFISPYSVIIADQRFILARMKNPPPRERGATKLDHVLV